MTQPLTTAPDPAHLGLEFLKCSLMGIPPSAKYKAAPPALLDEWPEVFSAWLRDLDPNSAAPGMDWLAEAKTMIGLDRLNNLQDCIESVIAENIPGDILEAGVWRGGASIFARAVLKAHGVSNRIVWLADSFQGVPKPDARRYEEDIGDLLWTDPVLAVSLEAVQENFRRYGLLDQQVAFLPGWFRDTLPAAPIGQLAVLRLDGDLYESTMIALRSLYPKLAIGGYVIVDDYGAMECCRAAVGDFRLEFGINEQIVPIDWTGVYWRVERSIPPITDILGPLRQFPLPRSVSLEYEPALHTLVLLYESRPDLQSAFPEAADWDFRRLIHWAIDVIRGQHHDGAAHVLTPFADWYALNSIDLPPRESVPEDLLDATSRESSGPQCIDISPHLVTLAQLVREFGLKEIVETGAGDGNSTVALLEAARAIGGRVLSIDVGPCTAAHRLIESLGLSNLWTFKQRNVFALEKFEIPEWIDLLFIDTFHLYSQTLAELRKFVTHLRPGSWIVLHASVAFPGVSKALLELTQTPGLELRFYPFVHQNGLSLVKVKANE